MTPAERRDQPARIAMAAMLAGLGLALAGCTGVVSDAPWFAQGGAAGGPQLREGVWRLASQTDKPCVVHEDAPLETWPECASGVVVRQRDLLALDRTKPGLGWNEAAYVLAGGDPPILQLSAGDATKPLYEYSWLRITKRDEAGRAVAVSGWRILCGPPAPASTAPAQAGLYDGLTAVDAGDCRAASLDALRHAAMATEADNPDDRTEAHWLRDGDR